MPISQDTIVENIRMDLYPLDTKVTTKCLF